MRFIFQLLILLVTGFHTFSQQARQYTFKHFTVTNGLASNSVNDVMQDNEGYIWIATISGLQRYDGNSFLTFTTQQGDPSAIPNSNINDLYKDRKGNLWIT